MLAPKIPNSAQASPERARVVEDLVVELQVEQHRAAVETRVEPLETAFPRGAGLRFEERDAGQREAVLVDVGIAQHLVAAQQHAHLGAELPGDGCRGHGRAVAVLHVAAAVVVIDLRAARAARDLHGLGERIHELRVAVALLLRESRSGRRTPGCRAGTRCRWRRSPASASAVPAGRSKRPTRRGLTLVTRISVVFGADW